MSTVVLIGVAVPLVWLGWLVMTEWVPMFPLNDLRRDNLKERLVAAAMNYPFPLLVAGGVALDRWWSAGLSLLLCALIVYGHVTSWWMPYFRPAAQWRMEHYRRDYSRTLKILPTEGHDITIDVQHMVVGVLTLAMVASTVAAATAL